LETFVLPLGVWFALRFVRAQRPRDAIACGLAIAVQAALGWYYTVHLLVVFTMILAVATIGGAMRWSREGVRWLAIGAVLAIALMLPLARPYWQEHRALPDYRRTLGAAALYSADVADYLRSLPGSRLELLAPRAARHPYWPGLVTVMLAIAGVAM